MLQKIFFFNCRFLCISREEKFSALPSRNNVEILKI